MPPRGGDACGRRGRSPAHGGARQRSASHARARGGFRNRSASAVRAAGGTILGDMDAREMYTAMRLCRHHLDDVGLNDPAGWC